MQSLGVCGYSRPRVSASTTCKEFAKFVAEPYRGLLVNALIPYCRKLIQQVFLLCIIPFWRISMRRSLNLVPTSSSLNLMRLAVGSRQRAFALAFSEAKPVLVKMARGSEGEGM